MSASTVDYFTTNDYNYLGSEMSGSIPESGEDDDMDVERKVVVRRVSTKNSHSDDLVEESDLRRDYQTAIDCLIQCESIIENMKEQLLSKEEMIASLEDKIMTMSLELASSMAREDHLQHKMKTSFTSVSLHQATNMTTSFTTATSVETGLQSSSPAPLSKDQPTLDDSATTRASVSKNFFGQILFGVRNELDVKNEDPNEHDDKILPLDDTSGVSKLGLFMRNSCSRMERRVEEMQMEPPKVDNYAPKVDNYDNNFGELRRRQPAKRRPSSKSFLETAGVVFPSNSLDVLAKGCMSINKSLDYAGGWNTKIKGATNEGWGEFR